MTLNKKCEHRYEEIFKILLGEKTKQNKTSHIHTKEKVDLDE